MPRPIDADALLKKIAHHTVHDSLKHITFEAANTYEQVKGDMFNLAQKAPAIDAVSVVRCKDCEYYDADCGFCDYWETGRRNDYFCATGERRESNATD